MHAEPGDEGPRPVEVAVVEGELERVVVVDVEDPGSELEYGATDEEEQAEPARAGWPASAAGGQANSLGMTDHSLASSTGTSANPNRTWVPWLTR